MKTPPPARVLITVAPPLLGDLVAKRLAGDDREVVVLEPVAISEATTRFDIVVTDRLLAPGIHADAVLSLPSRDPPDSGWLRLGDRVERVRLATLDEIAAVVDHICAKRRTQLRVVG